MMALLLQMQVRTLLQAQAVRKKDTSHQSEWQKILIEQGFARAVPKEYGIWR